MQHVINNFLSCKFHFGMLRAIRSFKSDLFFWKLITIFSIVHLLIFVTYIFFFLGAICVVQKKQFVSPLGLKGWVGTTTLKDAYMRVAGKHHIRHPLNVRYILFMNKTLVNMVPVSVRM